MQCRHCRQERELLAELANLSHKLHLEVLTTPACPFSEGAVRLAHQMAMESDMITADLVNVDDFPELVERYDISAAPTVIVDGNYCFYGALEESQFLEQVFKGTREGSM